MASCSFPAERLTPTASAEKRGWCMVSSTLTAHPAYMRGKSSARQFVLGDSLSAREEGLKGLNLVGFPLDVARKVIAIGDWGPRVAGLQAAATYHAQMNEGTMAAAIA